MANMAEVRSFFWAIYSDVFICPSRVFSDVAGMYELDEEALAEEVRRRGARRVVIQLPEGLKRFGPRLASVVEGAGAVALVLVDPCYGACGVAFQEAVELDADLIVHYGHSRMLSEHPIPTIYFDARMDVDLERPVREALKLLGGCRRVGVATTLQHVHKLNDVRRLLVDGGMDVVVGVSERTEYPGQVIGCDYGAVKSVEKEVDGFLFVGGRFHGLGAQLSTLKPVVVADPYEGRAYTLREDADRMLRRRYADIAEAREAESFGVIVGVLPGQRRTRVAMEAKRMLEKAGRKATLLAARYITPEALSGFRTVEAFVNTACPRISLDDAHRFERPILTFRELMVMLGRLRWEDICSGGWFGN